MQHHHENRKYPRISRKISVDVQPLTYPFLGKPGKASRGTDIGGGGIRIHTTDFYKVGTVLDLKIHIVGWNAYKKPFSKVLDISTSEPFTAIGEVVWCKKISRASEYELGIKFINLYEDDFRALVNYLENCG